MEKPNSMGNATIAIRMVTKPMNAKRNRNSKVNVTNAKSKVIRHHNANPNHLIQLNNLSKQYLDGTTTLGADVIIVENMVIPA